MEEKLSLKRHTWRIFKKRHRLVNCSQAPLRLPPRNKKGYLSKTNLRYFSVDLCKSQFLKVPEHIEYFNTYRVYLQYNCTLFDKKNKEFFGRTYLTVQENVCQSVDHEQGPFLETTMNDQIFFNLYDGDLDDILLVIEIILN